MSPVTMLAELRRLTVETAGRALDLALPPTCSGCRREGSPLCRECRGWIEVRLHSPPGAPMGLPVDIPAPLLQLEWCAPFTGITRRAVHDLKYAGERRLAKPLGEAIAARWRRAGVAGDILVPVPASPDRIRERGYDQAVLLGEVVARNLKLPMVPALERRHATVHQFGLDRLAREANVGRVFAIPDDAAGDAARAGIRDQWIVLVDDVVTTGATLAGCAEVLIEAGARAVSAVTLARER